ncbi:DMT family protein [Niabella sp. W65]|nr:DMT family protein [Niabella sp. W65]MCH7364361.1 DMT family protein [Niabella sp. W65]ULT40234.1 DMT family protein [Niabella sp. I65]
MKAFSSIGLLFLSNIFMTFAWYGHLKFFGKGSSHAHTSVWIIILISWGIAFLNIACRYLPTGWVHPKPAAPFHWFS